MGGLGYFPLPQLLTQCTILHWVGLSSLALRVNEMTTDRPANWYDDPDGSGGLRWWDGEHWTPTRQPKTNRLLNFKRAVVISLSWGVSVK